MLSAARLTSKLLPLAYPRVDLVSSPGCLAEDERGCGGHHGEDARPEHGAFSQGTDRKMLEEIKKSAGAGTTSVRAVW
jgi:hypothetical protein